MLQEHENQVNVCLATHKRSKLISLHPTTLKLYVLPVLQQQYYTLNAANQFTAPTVAFTHRLYAPNIRVRTQYSLSYTLVLVQVSRRVE